MTTKHSTPKTLTNSVLSKRNCYLYKNADEKLRNKYMTRISGGQTSIANPVALTAIVTLSLSCSSMTSNQDVDELTTYTGAKKEFLPSISGEDQSIATLPTNIQIHNLIDNFEKYYNDGNSSKFANLFTGSAITNDVSGKEEINNDYTKLFLSTKYRSILIQKISWEAVNGRVVATGQFLATNKAFGDKIENQYKGKFQLTAIKYGDQALITKLYHEYLYSNFLSEKYHNRNSWVSVTSGNNWYLGETGGIKKSLEHSIRRSVSEGQKNISFNANESATLFSDPQEEVREQNTLENNITKELIAEKSIAYNWSHIATDCFVNESQDSYPSASVSNLHESPYTTYKVRRGNTLSKISTNVYGLPTLWPVIYEKNKNIIGSNPNKIKPGQIYKLDKTPTKMQAEHAAHVVCEQRKNA